MLIPSERSAPQKSIKNRLIKGFSTAGLKLLLTSLVIALGLDFIFNSTQFLAPVMSAGFVALLASITLQLKLEFAEVYRKCGRWFILDVLVTTAFLVLEIMFIITGSFAVLYALLGCIVGTLGGYMSFWGVLVSRASSIKAQTMKQLNKRSESV